MDLKQFCLQSIEKLNKTHINEWAALFVSLRMKLQREYLKGFVLSTSHGIDIFENILACLDGAEWEEKGELGNNFRKFIGTVKRL